MIVITFARVPRKAKIEISPAKILSNVQMSHCKTVEILIFIMQISSVIHIYGNFIVTLTMVPV